MNINGVPAINGKTLPSGLAPKNHDQTERSAVAGEIPGQPKAIPPGGEKQGLGNENDLNKVIEGMNLAFEGFRTHLKFKLHEKLNEYYVQIVDDRTNEVIREVPPKKVLDMVAQMWEMAGLLIDEKH